MDLVVPPQLSEKISTQAGEDSELDLLETGKLNYFFTREDLPNSTKIHEDFCIFICLNVSSQSDKSIDPTLLSKCVCFCMPFVDTKEVDSSHIVYGYLRKKDLNREISQSIATRFSYLHREAKEKAKAEENSFSGDIKPTGRTLCFIGKEFNTFLNQLRRSAKK